MTIDVLGIEWTIKIQTLEENENFSQCDGYCDPSIKTIFVRKYTNDESNKFGYSDKDYMRNKVTRHEILHAFMYESGLWRNSAMMEEPWSFNEEMIDWIAIQGVKIYKAWTEANAL